MDGFILRYFLIKRIGYLTGQYSTQVVQPVHLLSITYRGFLIRVTLKSCFSCHPVHFGIGKNLYVRMPADLDQFG